MATGDCGTAGAGCLINTANGVATPAEPGPVGAFGSSTAEPDHARTAAGPDTLTLRSTREPRRDVLDVTMRVVEALGTLPDAVSLRLGHESRSALARIPVVIAEVVETRV